MSGHRIDRLIEARNLEEVPADDAEVAAIWATALREWSDATVAGLSVAGAFTHVYQAAFRAATAVLRAAGYRARGALGGYHYVTFYAIGGLDDRELERIGDAMQDIRGGRHTALYGERRTWRRKIWSWPAATSHGFFARRIAGWLPGGLDSRRALPRLRIRRVSG